jgi:hypothetical protein
MDRDPGDDQNDEAAETVSGRGVGARKDRPAKCPAHIKGAVRRAIAEHIQEHGREDWYLVRERPEFSTWIGVAAGPSAHKKFFRWVDDIAKPVPKDRTRPHESREVREGHENWAKVEAHLASAGAQLPVPVSPRHIMANGNRAIEGYAEIGRLLANGFDDLERIRAHALIDDPNGIGGQSAADPELLLKCAGKLCALIQTALGFLREVNATWAREEFNHALVQMLQERLSGHPDLKREVMAGLAELVREFGGVPNATP